VILDGAASDDGLIWNVDATNWRSLCRVRWVKQKDAHGCGVACLAMVAGESYERVRAHFVDQGLGEGRGRKHPFSTNFRELLAISALLGLKGTMKRWTGWQAVSGAGIIKVPTTGLDWHWVVVERTEAFGAVAHDPELDCPAFDRAPLDVMYRRPDSLRPSGNWISFQ
jgi:ABC-type bacteriocin/lantibiotic exporter with double-glycine peptidase domain